MRSGGYTLHHSLTAEAAATVKQAVSLARRRGHAQVTPLHVASAMLASPAGLLKRACLQSHSHPLQCKALDLCFNVALNRLPTSASTPLLGPLSHLPSLSNALVAAFKRAQAHQRRGSIENHQHQQQTILALKVEIEQLVISILDDPSVSRVMREAGFSSTQVKSNVEQAISTDKCSAQAPTTISQPTTTASSHHTNLSRLQNNDVSTVLEAMANKKTKNTVIVGECAATNENLVKRVIEKFDKKDVPYEMKSVQFISVPLFTLRNISKEEFELKLGELRSLVKSYVGRGVVLYLGDLDWVSEFWSKHGEQRSMLYSPIEFMIMELSRLVSGAEENYYKRIWLMGIASFNTYAKCKSGRPSLQTLWNLHPLTLGGLALGLSLDSMHDDHQVKKEAVDDLGIKKNLVCCFDCEENFRKEAQDVMSLEREFAPKSRLPSWLQQYKDENKKHQFEESDKIKDLCKKWNSICSSVHKKPHFLEKVLELSSSSSPSSSNSLSSDQNKSKILLKWPGIFDHDDVSKPSLALAKPELLSNPNSSPNSASSSEASEDMKLLNSDNLEILTAALEKKVPWQKDIVSDIVTTILKCRSRNMRRERRDSWLLFLGSDQNGKEIMAKELAKIVFGSDDDFFGMGISNFSSVTRSDSTEEVVSKKRGRDEKGGSVYDRFLEAVRDNPSRVFYVEDVDQLDRCCRKEFERAMENGSVSVGDDGEVLLLKDAIVIFSCESRDGFAAVDHGRKEKGEDDEEEEKPCGPLDLNVATDEVCGIGMLELVDMQVVFRIATLVN